MQLIIVMQLQVQEDSLKETDENFNLKDIKPVDMRLLSEQAEQININNNNLTAYGQIM